MKLVTSSFCSRSMIGLVGLLTLLITGDAVARDLFVAQPPSGQELARPVQRKPAAGGEAHGRIGARRIPSAGNCGRRHRHPGSDCALPPRN